MQRVQVKEDGKGKAHSHTSPDTRSSPPLAPRVTIWKPNCQSCRGVVTVEGGGIDLFYITAASVALGAVMHVALWVHVFLSPLRLLLSLLLLLKSVYNPVGLNSCRFDKNASKSGRFCVFYRFAFYLWFKDEFPAYVCSVNAFLVLFNVRWIDSFPVA